MRGMLMSLTTMSTFGVARDEFERLDPVVGEQEVDLAVADLLAEALGDQQGEIRLVVHDQHLGRWSRLANRHASRFPCAGCRSRCGLLSSPTAPRSQRRRARRRRRRRP